jgi:uncharacterized protein (TIGR03546 family)
MLSFVRIPAQIVSFLLGLQISAAEVAGGVCLAMFMGFVPFNGAMTVFLFILFFFLRINRLSTMLMFPFFKLLYIVAVGHVTGRLGEYLLIKADYLNGFWAGLVNLPIVAYLDMNNTLVAGGIVFSAVLSVPVYLVTKKLYRIYIENYVKRFLALKSVQKFFRYTHVHKIIFALDKIRSKTE